MNPVKWLLCWLDDVLCLGQSLNLRCNPILTRIFTFNFSAAVQLNPAGTKKKKDLQLDDSQVSPIQHTDDLMNLQLLKQKRCLDIIMTF